MTDTVEQAFWELLKAGLWGRQPVLAAKLSDEEWAEVMKHAKRQSLQGILFDGMLRLPEDWQPQEEIRMKWFCRVNKIEQSNRKLNHVLVEFIDKLQEQGIPSLLLKGQSYATLYPQPLHRQCGDIDLYIGPNHYKSACQWAKEWNLIGSKDEEGFRHQQITVDGINIDLHRVAIEFPNPLKHKRFREWSDRMLESSTSTFVPTTESQPIHIPELEYNMIFVFYHLLSHYFVSGIGLRQFCDWARMLHVSKSEIDYNRLEKDINDYGLMNAWQVFGYILVHQLGLPLEEFPFYKDTRKKSANLLEDILEQGNFGHYAEKQRPNASNYVLRRGKRFVFRTKRYIQTMRLFPSLGFGAYLLYLYERGGHFFTDIFKKA